MHYYEVAPTRIVRADADTLTYSSEIPLALGTIVEIEIGKRLSVGIILSESAKPSYDVKPVSRTIESAPLPEQLLQLTLWMSHYYKTPLATCLQSILPRGITKKRRGSATYTEFSNMPAEEPPLTPQQSSALEQLADSTGTALLHGVTGSGKTRVYTEQAKQILAKGRSVIMLVPEIALISQTLAAFSAQFPRVLMTHSRQTEAERHLVWQQALHATESIVVIGPRSALFMPISSVGLIIIDECHEPSFQQEQSPRYSSLRVASKYAELGNSLALFGSATPLVSDYFLADTNKKVIRIDTPARALAKKPIVTLVDMTKRANFHRHHFLSDQLITALETTFQNGKQALIFHNRRGSAPTTRCDNCGWQAGCSRCFVPLTLHSDKHELRCHICGNRHPVPTSCPSCHHASIIHKGIGTKLIETELHKLFPRQSIARFDGDIENTQDVASQYDSLKNGSIDLIIGTQVVAKGLDLPHLRTVGIVQADAGLSLPDYSSSERAFQLLAQVIGRVGRTEHDSTVIVQSYQPAHPAVQHGLTQDYSSFYAETLRRRQAAHFPPDRFLLKLTCIYKTEAATIRNTKKLREQLLDVAAPDVEILPPTPSFYERVSDTYRWQLVIKSPMRQHLLDLLDHLPPTHWQYELDPLSLL